MTQRFHAMSLAAVFFALTTGMVIGALFLQGPAFNATSAKAKELDTLSKELRDQNRQATEWINDSRKWIQNATNLYEPYIDKIVADKLKNRRVLIIVIGDYPNIATGIAQTVKDAGAEVSATITIDYAKLNDSEKQLILRRLNRIEEGFTTDNIKDISGIQGLSETPVPPTRLVVLVGGYKFLPDKTIPNTSFQVALIEQLGKLDGVSCAGAEPLECDVSTIGQFTSNNIPSVDCVDLAIGKLCVPFLFNDPGNSYGVKSTAKAVLPDEALAILAPEAKKTTTNTQKNQ